MEAIGQLEDAARMYHAALAADPDDGTALAAHANKLVEESGLDGQARATHGVIFMLLRRLWRHSTPKIVQYIALVAPEAPEILYNAWEMTKNCPNRRLL